MDPWIKTISNDNSGGCFWFHFKKFDTWHIFLEDLKIFFQSQKYQLIPFSGHKIVVDFQRKKYMSFFLLSLKSKNLVVWGSNHVSLDIGEGFYHHLDDFQILFENS